MGTIQKNLTENPNLSHNLGLQSQYTEKLTLYDRANLVTKNRL